MYRYISKIEKKTKWIYLVKHARLPEIKSDWEIDYLLKCMDSRAGIKGNVNKLKVNQNDFN